jgi:cytochrome P450
MVKDKSNALTPEQSRKHLWMPKSFQPLSRNMLDVDARDHTQLRALVHKAFAPRLSKPCVSRSRTSRTSCIPLRGVGGGWLGIPANERHQFHHWSNAIVSMNFSKLSMLKAIPNVRAFLAQVRKLVRLRREDLVMTC